MQRPPSSCNLTMWKIMYCTISGQPVTAPVRHVAQHKKRWTPLRHPKNLQELPSYISKELLYDQNEAFKSRNIKTIFRRCTQVNVYSENFYQIKKNAAWALLSVLQVLDKTLKNTSVCGFLSRLETWKMTRCKTYTFWDGPVVQRAEDSFYFKKRNWKTNSRTSAVCDVRVFRKNAMNVNLLMSFIQSEIMFILTILCTQNCCLGTCRVAGWKPRDMGCLQNHSSLTIHRV